MCKTIHVDTYVKYATQKEAKKKKLVDIITVPTAKSKAKIAHVNSPNDINIAYYSLVIRIIFINNKFNCLS